MEAISGLSGMVEVRHVRAALLAGRGYIGVCMVDGIRERIRRYFRDVEEDGVRMRLVTVNEIEEQR